jgi:uncharacterized repeat protein (TIGR01451 family)
LARAARFTGVGALILTAVVTLGASAAVAVNPPTVGPVFPAPGSGTWTSTGTPMGGEIGHAGGITWSYSGVDPSQFLQMVWGMGYPTYQSTFSFGLDTATLSFDPMASNLAGGALVFSGFAEFPNLDLTTPSYQVRLLVTTLTGPTSFVTPASLSGLTVDPSAGGVLHVTGDFSVNLLMQVTPDGGNTWIPANDYFDATPHVASVSTSTSVFGDFWYTQGAPVVSFGQNPLAFGAHDQGTTTQLTETVNNTGNAPLVITQIDTNADYSAPTDTCVGHSIAAGSSCTIDVDFTPTMGGDDNGTLVLHDNAADSPQTLQLTGIGTQPEAVLTPNPVNFGSVVLGSNHQATLSVSNPGTATLHITNGTFTGPNPGDFAATGLSPGCLGFAVQPGGTCVVTFTFTPGGDGPRSATFTLTDNANPSTQSVTLTGVGTRPMATVGPSNLDFGSIPVGASSGPHAVTVTSTGDAALHVTGYSFAGANPADFSIIGGSCPAPPFNLGTGSTCTFDVLMSPAGSGGRTATLSVMDNAVTGDQQLLVGGNGTSSADTSVFIKATSFTVKNGAKLTYKVVVKNSGPSTAAGTVLTDALPSSETFVSITGAGCSTPAAGFSGTIACSLGAMSASSTSTFTFVVKVHAKVGNTVTNRAHVRATTFDALPDNNTAKVAVRVK